MLSFEQCFILFSSFPLLLAFDVGGLGLEFCVFVAGWRHALRSEWHRVYMYGRKKPDLFGQVLLMEPSCFNLSINS